MWCTFFNSQYSGNRLIVQPMNLRKNFGKIPQLLLLWIGKEHSKKTNVSPSTTTAAQSQSRLSVTHSRSMSPLLSCSHRRRWYRWLRFLLWIFALNFIHIPGSCHKTGANEEANAREQDEADEASILAVNESTLSISERVSNYFDLKDALDSVESLHLGHDPWRISLNRFPNTICLIPSTYLNRQTRETPNITF